LEYSKENVTKATWWKTYLYLFFTVTDNQPKNASYGVFT